ncbi:alpha/beta hydrolase-fold protein [Saprospiraceae bacterium]|jgi:esterase/lipase superfamily enzyme|nr:alpha/beta hydrolase-fold protein [Bacteroidota bacterium]MDB4727387.1 alpha/beta hydrolase-fold protein [Saprospiraceae bacterium]MDF1865076.1 alpha/beta hydrolase-fold protein [Saprospiraceae bacterium]
MYKEEFFKWHSPTLSMEMKMLVFGHSGYPVVLFPTTMGRYYEVKDFKLVDSAKWFLENGMIQIFCPDGINDLSWYNKEVHPAHRAHNHNCYDQMIVNEIVDKVRWNTPSGKVAVAGPSFGGYHAANFAFKHPEKVSHLFSMSGAFDIKSFVGDYYDDNVYFNNPVDYLPNLNHPDLWKMKIVLGTSEWDILKSENEHFSHILNQKGIDHWLDMRGWVEHDWPLWREMFPHYLSLMN